MGKVDCCSLCRCGIRMNGVLIEWNSWLGYFLYFHFFTRTYMSHNTKTYLQNAVSHIITLLWGYK